jgi:hypothetical protein
MKKALLITAAAMFFAVFITPPLSGTGADITGNWVGSTLIPNMGEDEIVLTLKREGDAYSALLNDKFGLLQNVESTSCDYREDQLVMRISVPGAYGTTEVTITLAVAGDTMTGTWQTQESEKGTITLTRE